MNAIIPDTWQKVDEWVFADLMMSINYTREAFADVDFYNNSNRRIGAYHITTKTYYIDPDYWK